MIVTVDGPVASGKSSIALIVASAVGFSYINSGLFFRAATHCLLMSGKSEDIPDNIASVIVEALDRYLVCWDRGSFVLSIDNRTVGRELFNPEIDSKIHLVANNEYVRSDIKLRLLDIAADYDNVIFDGRNLAVEVFPFADLKIFLTADVKERSRRRFEQWDAMGSLNGMSLDDVHDSIVSRDDKDAERLTISAGCWVFDNSNYSQEETVELIVDRINCVKKSNL